jgi:hypothetical protein
VEWETLEACPVYDMRRWETFVVPKGFRCDLASVPRWLWPIISLVDLSLIAPVAHDWIYKRGGVVESDGRTIIYTRFEADNLFLGLMWAAGVPEWRRWLAYLAVRLFGGRSWKSTTNG